MSPVFCSSTRSWTSQTKPWKVSGVPVTCLSRHSLMRQKTRRGTSCGGDIAICFSPACEEAQPTWSEKRELQTSSGAENCPSHPFIGKSSFPKFLSETTLALTHSWETHL